MRGDLTDLLYRLSSEGVDFVLVGGFAAVAHGCSLVTRDVDVVIALDQENLKRVWKALEGLSPRFAGKDPPLFFEEQDSVKGGWKNLYLDTDIGRLDCLGEVKGIGDFSKCLSASVSWPLSGFEIRLLSREKLIEAKKAMGRPRDLLAVQELEMGGESD